VCGGLGFLLLGCCFFVVLVGVWFVGCGWCLFFTHNEFSFVTTKVRVSWKNNLIKSAFGLAESHKKAFGK
jgi:hypothetical protein